MGRTYMYLIIWIVSSPRIISWPVVWSRDTPLSCSNEYLADTYDDPEQIFLQITAAVLHSQWQQYKYAQFIMVHAVTIPWTTVRHLRLVFRKIQHWLFSKLTFCNIESCEIMSLVLCLFCRSIPKLFLGESCSEVISPGKMYYKGKVTR